MQNFQSKRTVGRVMPLLGVIATLSLLLVTQYKQRIHDTESAGQIVGEALRIYRIVHNRLPDADRWEQELLPYIKVQPNDFGLPASFGVPKHHFAMIRSLSGLTPDRLNPPEWERPILFESTATGPNAADEMTSLPPKNPLHGFIVIYADGGAEYVQPSERDNVIKQAKRNLERN